jgi:hypothetical protein
MGPLLISSWIDMHATSLFDNRQLGCEGRSPPHPGHWQDVVPEEHCASPEERLPVRIGLNINLVCMA